MGRVKKDNMVTIDPSPTGTALTYYVGRTMVDFRFTTEVKKWAKLYKEEAILIPNVKKGDENARMERLAIVEFEVQKFLNVWGPSYIGIEDYIWHTHGKGGGVIQVSELGGVIRLLLFNMGYRLRTYEPMSVKIARTGMGNADKEDMMEVAREELAGTEMGDYLERLPGKYFENIADSMAVAELLDWELRLRRGLTTTREMPKRIVRVVNRVTKAVPDCLLDRPFVARNYELREV